MKKQGNYEILCILYVVQSTSKSIDFQPFLVNML